MAARTFRRSLAALAMLGLTAGALDAMRSSEDPGEDELDKVDTAGIVIPDLPSNWLYEPTNRTPRQLDLPANWSSDADLPDASKSDNSVLVPADGDKDVPWNGGSYCIGHTHEHKCYLYNACRGRSYCVMGNYMIVAGFPCPGMESINGGNAGNFDFLMGAARGRCGSPGCVLITNPVGHRTQEQLHIHYRYMNGRGAALKRHLERTLCGTHGWRPFHKCGSAKARLYSGFPGVFSEVAKAYGGGSLANVGITVWFTKACGGYQTMVLATTHCSIEHSISAR